MKEESQQNRSDRNKYHVTSTVPRRPVFPNFQEEYRCLLLSVFGYGRFLFENRTWNNGNTTGEIAGSNHNKNCYYGGNDGHHCFISLPYLI
jgi:hypothetical protein